MTEIATLAGGCFWCTEAVFDALKGVAAVEFGVHRRPRHRADL